MKNGWKKLELNKDIKHWKRAAFPMGVRKKISNIINNEGMSQTSYDKNWKKWYLFYWAGFKLVSNSQNKNLPNPSLVFFLIILQFPVKWVNLSMFSIIVLDIRWEVGKVCEKKGNFDHNLLQENVQEGG